jgi:predicted metal-dependent HD superfamily phosphohydrolase
VTTDEELIDRAVTAAGLGSRYAQAHREYHNLVHIEHVLAEITRLEPAESALLPLCLAAWFHDAIYAPGRDDNEERSAFLARDTLELVGASPEVGHEVARLVRLTASHTPAPDDAAGAVLCDADLSILGMDPASYEGYAAAIRQEYSLVPDQQFLVGRAQVLQGLLDRPTIFHTSLGRELWEDAARTNLGREVGQLEGSLH